MEKPIKAAAHSTFRSFLAVMLALFGFQAGAHTRDEQWITDRIIAGKYDELRALKAESDKGSPVAQFYWGLLQNACIYDRCNPVEADRLWRKAAKAGNARARIELMHKAQSGAGLDKLFDEIGWPETLDEQIAQLSVLLVLSDSKPRSKADPRALLKKAIEAEPQLRLLMLKGLVDGFGEDLAPLRAMVESGFEIASEHLHRWMLMKDRVRRPEQLVKARAGDQIVAVALCHTSSLVSGAEKLPAELLPLCETAAKDGYIALSAPLLRHYRLTGDLKAAAQYAEGCVSHASLACAKELAAYYRAKSGDTENAEAWGVVSSLAEGLEPKQVKKAQHVMRKALSIRVRAMLTTEACAKRKYNFEAKRFTEAALCTWRTRSS
jgi:hypothetical protein